MIFASDMDNTIMFSKRHFDINKEDVVCVDSKGNSMFSFMLADDIEKLRHLSKQITFIPVTARSIEQYTRTLVSQIPKYAICTSGGIILENGKEMPEWKEHIEELRNEYNIDLEYGINLLREVEGNTDEIRIVDDLYVYEYLWCDDEMVKVILKHLDENLDKNWLYTLQGRKLYIMPAFISKEYALEFLANKLNDEVVVTAGDGKLDVGLLKAGKIKIIPEGSEVLHFVDFEHETVPPSLAGVSKLLDRVESLI